MHHMAVRLLTTERHNMINETKHEQDTNTGLKMYTITYAETETFSVDVFAESQEQATWMAQATMDRCVELDAESVPPPAQRAIAATAEYHGLGPDACVDLWELSQSLGYVEVDVAHVTEG